MSPQIIPHYLGAQTSNLKWDSDLIAQSPYVIGLSGCILKTVVDTYADLASLSSLKQNDQVLVWGADSSETMIYIYDGSAFPVEGSGYIPVSNVQYVRKDTKETMYFYVIQSDSVNTITVEGGNPTSGNLRNKTSVLGLIPNVYVIGTVYFNSAELHGWILLQSTSCETTAATIARLTSAGSGGVYTIPIKSNGLFVTAAATDGATNALIGFKAA